MSTSNVTINASYLVSVGLALGTVYLIHMKAPETSVPIKFFVAPFLVGYLAITAMNSVTPDLSKTSYSMADYAQGRFMDTLANTGYIQIFTPLFVVLLITLILFYSSRAN